MQAHAQFSDVAPASSGELAYAGRVLDSLTDPEAGAVGQRILDNLRQSNCEVRIQAPPPGSQAANDGAGAVYTSFDDEAPETNFVHNISITPGGSSLRLPISIAHEGGSHAQAWNNAPILHASPYNTGNPAKPDLVLCPRDWVRLVVLTEQDAYAKEKWIASLAAQHDPRFNTPEAIPLATREMFREIRARTGNLHDALVEIANQSMDAHFANDSYQFGHFYVGDALTTYHNNNRLKDNPSGLIPVRMELEDLLMVGETIGPNIFDDERLYGRGDLSRFIFEDGEQQIRELNAKLGITDEAALPTFRDALAHFGLTPEEFLRRSKQPLSAPRPAHEHSAQMAA